MVLASLMRSNMLMLNESEIDLLDDIQIENQQAIEMAEISNSIINERADTYSSIINNMNNVTVSILFDHANHPGLVFSFWDERCLPLANFKISWIVTIAISLTIAGL